MDLLYSRYASPMDLMKLYVEQGRFGEFVSEILDLDYKRKREELKKEDDMKLWTMYVHSMTEMSFNDWKAKVLSQSTNQSKGSDYDMTEDDVVKIIDSLFKK